MAHPLQITERSDIHSLEYNASLLQTGAKPRQERHWGEDDCLVLHPELGTLGQVLVGNELEIGDFLPIPDLIGRTVVANLLHLDLAHARLGMVFGDSPQVGKTAQLHLLLSLAAVVRAEPDCSRPLANILWLHLIAGQIIANDCNIVVSRELAGDCHAGNTKVPLSAAAQDGRNGTRVQTETLTRLQEW